MKYGLIFIVLIAVLSLLMGTSIQAVEMPLPIPHAFYGSLTINGQPAPAGTQVSAEGIGVVPDTEGNPLTTVTAGQYGGAAPTAAKLIVQGDIPEGTTITFYIEGIKVDQTVPWHSGATTQLPLSVFIGTQPQPTPTPTPTPAPIPIPTPVNGGGTSGSPFEGILNFFGQNYTYNLDESGAITKTITLTSPTANLVVIIPKGTILKDQAGNFLTPLIFTICTDAAAPPEGMAFLGKAVNSTPDGASFNPYINLQLGYDPDGLPAGILEQAISAAFYDSATEQWQKLEGTLDSIKNTLTIKVSHLCCFALFYPVTAAPAASVPAETTTAMPNTSVPTGGIAGIDSGATTTNAATPASQDTQASAEIPPAKSALTVYLTIALAIVCLFLVLVIVRRKRK